MKKGLLLLLTASLGLFSCLKNDPYVEPQSSDLKGKLFINEYNGTGGPGKEDAEKYVELYNAGNAEINLAGLVLEYGGKETWKGKSGDVIPAKGYFVLQGTKGTGDMSTGLSANNVSVTLDLMDQDGNFIDSYAKAVDLNGHAVLENKVHVRIPDGGTWYYCETSLVSKGSANVSSPTTAGVIQPMDDNVVITPPTLQVGTTKVTPANPTPDQDVIISITASDSENALTVTLKWKNNGSDQSDIVMTKSGDSYSATIPAQTDGSVIAWAIEVNNGKDATVEKKGSITFSTTPAPVVDYMQLRINEINGTGGDDAKYVEIYNMSNTPISLEGVSLHYNNSSPDNYKITWTGTTSDIVPAKGYFVIEGAKSEYPSMSTGLSANNEFVKVQLRKPDEQAIDTYSKPFDLNAHATLEDKAHTRIPDGTGDWYYTATGTGSKDATNGTSTAGCVKFGNE
ncbi:MAG: lamin tail domain-containing protein [Bacteroidales bacterium]|jgi:hypothetical protein|nr:lamin tail domain-containing protein [Bacteroidales bacterium]